jgi:hypothetical protein
MADDYYAEVAYQVWSRGGNPDLVDRDRVEERQQEGYTEDETSLAEFRRQQRGREEQRERDEERAEAERLESERAYERQWDRADYEDEEADRDHQEGSDHGEIRKV